MRGISASVFTIVATVLLAGSADARSADCLLEVDGRSYIDGICDFDPAPRGSFQISTRSSGRLEFVAELDVLSSGAARGAWNGARGDGRYTLGVLTPAGACWVNSRARVCAWKVGEPRYFEGNPVAPQPVPPPLDAVPRRVGECVQTEVSSLGSRLDGMPDSGTSIGYANGIYGVSYQVIEAIRESRVGDRVMLCLVSVPTDCPKGDDRGKVYSAINSRTGRGWSLPDSQHMCGGA